MTVSDCVVASEAMSANAAVGIIELNRDQQPVRLVKALSTLAEMSAICNAGEFDASTFHLPLAQRKVHGDATDQAILRFAEALVSVSYIREKWQRLFRVAFNSRNKFMIQVIKAPAEDKEENEAMLTIKGAPDILLPRCLFFMDSNGVSQPFSEAHRIYINELKDKWSAQGKRVILLARKQLNSRTTSFPVDFREFEDAIMDESARGLELVGLVGILDPPKDEIPEVIRILRGAGIKVHMVTGDFKLTAQAIAAECGIITVPADCVEKASALSLHEVSDVNSPTTCRAIALSGEELKGLNESQWDKLCEYDEIVFARTTPEQKLKIVKEMQARGEIVGSKFSLISHIYLHTTKVYSQ
jgi:sodium/potassium-transporting ATPase subunit alpha